MTPRWKSQGGDCLAICQFPDKSARQSVQVRSRREVLFLKARTYSMSPFTPGCVFPQPACVRVFVCICTKSDKNKRTTTLKSVTYCLELLCDQMLSTLSLQLPCLLLLLQWFPTSPRVTCGQSCSGNVFSSVFKASDAFQKKRKKSRKKKYFQQPAACRSQLMVTNNSAETTNTELYYQQLCSCSLKRHLYALCCREIYWSLHIKQPFA